MKRFIVERTWPNGLNILVDENGNGVCQAVVKNNSTEQVTWVHSYVSEEKSKSFCVYDGPSGDAIKTAAELNNQPVDRVIEVRVPDPYFYN